MAEWLRFSCRRFGAAMRGVRSTGPVTSWMWMVWRAGGISAGISPVIPSGPNVSAGSRSQMRCRRRPPY
ncbi:hypothetical protein AMK26_17325 [Streptomyces sp. CB03234]|nr:hypothetical protein AMK26_17325 [Streptomyces sp. CB03234]